MRPSNYREKLDLYNNKSDNSLLTAGRRCEHAVSTSPHLRRKRNCSSKMALPGVSLVRLRALCNTAKCLHTVGKSASNWGREMRWYRTKARNFQDFGSSHLQDKRGECEPPLARLAHRVTAISARKLKDIHHVT